MVVQRKSLMKTGKLEQTSVEMSLQLFSKYSILDLTLTEYMFVNYMNLISIEYGLNFEILNLNRNISYKISQVKARKLYNHTFQNDY